jgi:hypothetical protein
LFRLPRTKFLLVASMLLLAVPRAPGAAQQGVARETSRLARAGSAAATEAELTKLRAEVIQRTADAREKLVKLLAVYERDLQRRAEELELRREFYNRELISRLELEETERGVAQTRVNIQQVRRWIAEDDILLTEALAEEEIAKLSRSPSGSYTVTNALIRYNGGAPWSLADAGKIERYFVNLFGRALPVSAFGQSPVHDQLGYDHRDAMDVAVHPDSREGQALMDYLRKEGIPFIAFRGRVAGSATGAHVHIGKPSMRFSQR